MYGKYGIILLTVVVCMCVVIFDIPFVLLTKMYVVVCTVAVCFDARLNIVWDCRVNNEPIWIDKHETSA